MDAGYILIRKVWAKYVLMRGLGSEMNVVSRVKNYIKPYYRSAERTLLKHWFDKRHLRLREEFHRQFIHTNTIPVVFLVQFPEMWNSEKAVYAEMMENPVFRVSILCVPKYKSESNSGVVYDEQNAAYDYLRGKGYDVIDARTEEGWFDLKKLKPSYIIIQRPYENQLPEEYSFSKLASRAFIAYIPYAYTLSKDTHVRIAHNLRFLKYCTFDFSPNNNERDYFETRKFCTYSRCPQVGFPRFDLYPAAAASELGIARTVLWTPRWYYGDNNNNTSFFRYYKPLLDFFRDNGQYNLIIRPHPLMFLFFLSHEIISKDDYDTILKTIASVPNVELDNDNDYLVSFQRADVMLSDFSSLLIEFFITGKPILYCGEYDDFNEAGLMISQFFHKIEDEASLRSALTDILGTHYSVSKARREAIWHIMDPDSSASKKIVDFLESYISQQTQ